MKPARTVPAWLTGSTLPASTSRRGRRVITMPAEVLDGSLVSWLNHFKNAAEAAQ
jgi:hypothetical protein